MNSYYALKTEEWQRWNYISFDILHMLRNMRISRWRRQELHVSQPSISKAIQALERELNTELLRKNGRSCVLTHDGYLLAGKDKLQCLEELERIPLEFRNRQKKRR